MMTNQHKFDIYLTNVSIMYSSVKARSTYKHVILLYFNLLLFKLFFNSLQCIFLHYQITHLDNEQRDMLSSTTQAKLAHILLYIHNYEIRFIDMDWVCY